MGTDWRAMQPQTFFSVVQAWLARRLGGPTALEERLETVVNESKAAAREQTRGPKRDKMANRRRVLSLEEAKRIEADAEDYDTKVAKGR